MFAITEENYEIVLELLDRGADITKEDNSGWIALTHASWIGNNDIYQLILDRKTNYITEEHFKKSICLAEMGGYSKIVEDLKERCRSFGYSH